MVVKFLAYTNEVSITLGDDGCLEVPKIHEIQSLYVVWPNGDNTDCICPLCDDSDCTLHNCECYNSAFAPELQLKSGTSLNGNYTLCWPRLSSDQNNSEVYFFFEVSTSSSDLSLINRVYGNNNNFVVRGETSLKFIRNYHVDAMIYYTRSSTSSKPE